VETVCLGLQPRLSHRGPSALKGIGKVGPGRDLAGQTSHDGPSALETMGTMQFSLKGPKARYAAPRHDKGSKFGSFSSWR